jgi:hypothetical protein
MVRLGDHYSSVMSRQIEPVIGEMFGCQIGVSNFIRGATNG